MSLIVTIYQPILKLLLMRYLALVSFYESYISTQTTAISDLGDALITWEQEARTISLKIWMFLMTLSIIPGVTERLVFS